MSQTQETIINNKRQRYRKRCCENFHNIKHM